MEELKSRREEFFKSRLDEDPMTTKHKSMITETITVINAYSGEKLVLGVTKQADSWIWEVYDALVNYLNIRERYNPQTHTVALYRGSDEVTFTDITDTIFMEVKKKERILLISMSSVIHSQGRGNSYCTSCHLCRFNSPRC